MAEVVDPVVHHAQWRVRHYELDDNGHVNNGVYLNYAEHLTLEHAESSGFGQAWTREHGGAWVVHRNVVSYHRPAYYRELLDLTVKVIYARGARGIRHTEIRRAATGELLAEVLTEWVWTRLDTGRPGPIPEALVQAARAATEETLRRNPQLLQNLRRGATV